MIGWTPLEALIDAVEQSEKEKSEKGEPWDGDHSPVVRRPERIVGLFLNLYTGAFLVIWKDIALIYNFFHCVNIVSDGYTTFIFILCSSFCVFLFIYYRLMIIFDLILNLDDGGDFLPGFEYFVIRVHYAIKLDSTQALNTITFFSTNQGLKTYNLLHRSINLYCRSCKFVVLSIIATKTYYSFPDVI